MFRLDESGGGKKRRPDNRAKEAKAKQARAKQARAEEARRKQARAKQARAEEARLKQARAEEARAKKARLREARADEPGPEPSAPRQPRPKVRAAREPRSKPDKATDEPQLAFSDEAIVVVDRSVNPYLVLFHDPTGYRAEQIRSLRNKLIAMNPDGASKTLVVTSAIRGEGKSVTALNLAMAFAERERTPVILVEADMRFPCVEQYLQLNPAPGLSDVLLGRTDLDHAIRPSGVRNLDVLGAGGSVASPAELLTSHRIEELFAWLKARYQYVVVDTPPAAPATDASVMSACADGTLLVIRLEHSSRKLAREAVRNLEDLGANMLGVFVTEDRGSNPEADARLTYSRPREDS